MTEMTNEPGIRTIVINEPPEFHKERQRKHDEWLRKNQSGEYAPDEHPDTGTDHGDYWVGRDW